MRPVDRKNTLAVEMRPGDRSHICTSRPFSSFPEAEHSRRSAIRRREPIESR
jgi:hypothetical protein